MTHGKKVGEWGVFERVVTLLLAACVILLAAQAALTWFYVSGITQEIQVVSANQAETARALLAEKTQQATPNPEFDAVVDELHSNLSAIRDELHALNEKASIAAGVTRPRQAALSDRGSNSCPDNV